MDPVITVLLAAISVLLSFNIYLLSSLRGDIRDLREVLEGAKESHGELEKRVVVLETKMGGWRE